MVFPVDFYVLNIEEDSSSNFVPILIGRPFLKTVSTKIYVHKGTLPMEFDGEVIEFNMNDTMKYPSEEHSVFSVDVINPIVQEVFYKKKTKIFHARMTLRKEFSVGQKNFFFILSLNFFRVNYVFAGLDFLLLLIFFLMVQLRFGVGPLTKFLRLIVIA